MSKEDYTFVPVYKVYINGVLLGIDKTQCITSITIKQTDEGASSCTLVIYDPKFLFVDDNIFLEENTIAVKMGISTSTYRKSFSGYISAVDIDFASDGVPCLTLTCMDNTHRMNRKKKNRTWKNCTSVQVIYEIIKSYGFLWKREQGYNFIKKETISQSNQTDIEFITNLARNEVHPFSARLEKKDNKFWFLYLKSGVIKTPIARVKYGEYPYDVISFSPRLNKESKRVEIEKSTVDSEKNVSTTTGTTNTQKGTSSSSGNTSKTSKSTAGMTYDPKTKTWSKTTKK